MTQQMNRREFLKSLGIMTAGVSLTQFYSPAYAEALAAVAKNAPPVIWFSGGTCGGCSIAALDAMHPKIEDTILNLITLHYHINIGAGSGDVLMKEIYRVMEEQKGKYIYVQEGVIPTAADGKLCVVGELNGKKVTMMEMAKKLAANANAVVAVGACPSFGGIPSASPNPTGVKPLSAIVDKPVINIPGCPAHPDDVFGTLIYYIKHGFPELDKFNRPKLFFGSTIHDNCPLLPSFEKEDFASNFGENKCYAKLGCMGPSSYCDAWKRGWNNNTNWCVKCGSHCIGCTEPTFVKTKAGIYGSAV